jgi:phage antirepressor YoqD-like protein
MYATPEAVEAMLADPDTMIQTLKALKEERQLRELAESTIEKQKPLVTFAETCLASKDSILVRELAKIINNQGIPTGEHKLYAWMREKGLLMRGNEPYQRYIQSGYFVVEQKPFDTPYGTKMIRTTRVTPRGQAYIIKRLTGIEGEKNHG